MLLVQDLRPDQPLGLSVFISLLFTVRKVNAKPSPILFVLASN